MSSIGEAENVTDSTQRTEEDDDLMEGDAMSEPTINLSDDDKDEVTGSKSKGRPSSIVWRHFDQVTRKGQVKPDRAKCKYCRSDYKWLSGNVTSTLKKHMLRCLKNPENVKAKRQKTIASYAQVKGGCDDSGLGTWKFDQKACRDALARMILMDELAFRFVERAGFRAFCRVLQPLFKEISRVTVARDCVDLYASEKTKIKNLFRKSNQRVCLTTDSWTSLQNLSYMCLTAHFIDKDWILHKRILNFCVISSHKGEAIGKALETCMIEWGVGRVCTITVDNASANDVAIAYLKKKLSKKSGALILGGEFLHMRCCAHIINLIVRDGLSEIKESISRIRDVVKYVRSSPQREQRFKGCVVSEGITSKNFVCLDVPTRWNSTYLMLRTALLYQKAFERLEEDDPLFLSELHMGPPSPRDWDDARCFTEFLEKFYDATLHLSGSSYSTSNMYFNEVIAIDGFLSDYLNDVDVMYEGGEGIRETLVGMARKMKKKFDKYWGKVEKMNMMMFIAIVLDPRYKLRYVKFCFSELFDSELEEELTQMIKEVLDRVFLEYEKFNIGAAFSAKNSSGMEVDQPCSGRSEKGGASLESKFQKQLEEEDDGGKSEVDKYLEERCQKKIPNFNILEWWKLNACKYPVLAEIARDALAIHVSTVASEAAFSTGGRVIDQFRSSLSPKLVECLICMQDWLRATPLPFEVEENMEEMQELELALQKVSLHPLAAGFGLRLPCIKCFHFLAFLLDFDQFHTCSIQCN